MNSVGRLARFTLHKTFSPFLTDGAQRNLAVSSVMTGAKGVGLYWILTIIGLDPSPLLAVFGMFGVAIGFAGKDLASNFISGAVLAGGRTLKKGDKITVGTLGSGVLIDMDMKYIYLEQPDGTLLLVPNGTVTTSVVSIAGAASMKRTETELYDKMKKDSELSEDSHTRRGRRILYFIFVVLPVIFCCALIGFMLSGDISFEDVQRWARNVSDTCIGKLSETVENEEPNPEIGGITLANSDELSGSLATTMGSMGTSSSGLLRQMPFRRLPQ